MHGHTFNMHGQVDYLFFTDRHLVAFAQMLSDYLCTCVALLVLIPDHIPKQKIVIIRHLLCLQHPGCKEFQMRDKTFIVNRFLVDLNRELLFHDRDNIIDQSGNIKGHIHLRVIFRRDKMKSDKCRFIHGKLNPQHFS